MMTRRYFLTASTAGGFALASSPIARAQAYPSRPITMVVPFPAGGPTDATARVLAEQMRGSLGQPSSSKTSAELTGTSAPAALPARDLMATRLSWVSAAHI